MCSAFVLGADREIQRSSDDGEPAGTAGIPMLQALLARQTRINESGTDLSDLVAVVVRYFGGIKLGAGGLVRAYTDAVVQTLDNVYFDSRERMRVGTVLVSLAEVGRVKNEIRASGIEVAVAAQSHAGGGERRGGTVCRQPRFLPPAGFRIRRLGMAVSAQYTGRGVLRTFARKGFSDGLKRFYFLLGGAFEPQQMLRRFTEQIGRTHV